MKRILLSLITAAAMISVAAQTTASEVPTDSLELDSAQMSLLNQMQQLDEVVVTTQRQLVKTEIDRLSYNVQADGDSKTKTVLEMLRKVPLVSVDGQDEIRVKGSTNFKIYKNGHPDPILSSNPKEVLKAVPASMIKRIEVITEPGAKYDAEGVSAILNIVMNDASNMSGITGTVSAGIDTDGSPSGSAYITAQHGKLVTSLNYGFTHRGRNSNKQRGDTWQAYAATGDTLSTVSNGDASVGVHYGNLDLSYEPDTLNLISASVGGFYYNYSADALGTTSFKAADGTPIYRFTSNTHVKDNSYYNVNGRVDYQHKTHRKNEAITLSYMLSSTQNKSNNDMHYSDMWNAPMTYSGNHQTGKESFWEHTWQFDWTRPFAKYHKMETGLKYIHRSNTSRTTMTYLDAVGMPDLDSHFKHLTQVGAVYASYTYSRDKLTARAGLRYEWSYLKASYPDGSQQSFHRTLNDWVPSASINYQFDFSRSLKWAFSTSINRPGISYLNPAVIENPTSVHFGNAHLGSARNYSTSITYMQIGPKFTFNISPNFSWSNNEITAVKWSEDGKDIDTYENTMTRRYVGVSGFFQWQVFATTSMMFNGNFGHNYYRSKALGLKNSGHWESFFYTQITQQLPWQLQLTGNVGKWGGGIDGLYGYNGNTWFYGFGLQRNFLKENRLTVRLNAQMPFSSRYGGFTQYTTQGDYTGTAHYDWTQRNFSINISYRFGSLNARVKKADKTIENTDVVGGSQSAGQSAGSGGRQTGN